MIPPAYGARVRPETLPATVRSRTGMAYVGGDPDHGRGSFEDPRLGISVQRESRPGYFKLPALAEYTHPLGTRQSGRRGRSAARPGERPHYSREWPLRRRHLPDSNSPTSARACCISPDETGMGPCLCGPDRDQHGTAPPRCGDLAAPPYFPTGAPPRSSGRAHYDGCSHLGSTPQQEADLAAYLRTR